MRARRRGVEARGRDFDRGRDFCPEAMQDAAWDTCLGGPLYKLANGDCACLPSGNPPLPPLAATCPGGDKR